MLQSETGYIDARPLTANSTKFSCNARPDHTLGHSRPMHSVPVPINVRCYSNSDIIARHSEVTLRAQPVWKGVCMAPLLVRRRFRDHGAPI